MNVINRAIIGAVIGAVIGICGFLYVTGTPLLASYVVLAFSALMTFGALGALVGMLYGKEEG